MTQTMNWQTKIRLTCVILFNLWEANSIFASVFPQIHFSWPDRINKALSVCAIRSNRNQLIRKHQSNRIGRIFVFSWYFLDFKFWWWMKFYWYSRRIFNLFAWCVNVQWFLARLLAINRSQFEPVEYLFTRLSFLHQRLDVRRANDRGNCEFGYSDEFPTIEKNEMVHEVLLSSQFFTHERQFSQLSLTNCDVFEDIVVTSILAMHIFPIINAKNLSFFLLSHWNRKLVPKIEPAFCFS